MLNNGTLRIKKKCMGMQGIFLLQAKTRTRARVWAQQCLCAGCVCARCAKFPSESLKICHKADRGWIFFFTLFLQLVSSFHCVMDHFSSTQHHDPFLHHPQRRQQQWHAQWPKIDLERKHLRCVFLFSSILNRDFRGQEVCAS